MKIQDIYLALGKSGCLLLCYGFVAGVKKHEIADEFNELVDSLIISKDCYVKNADSFFRFFNSPLRVEKCAFDEARSEHRCVRFRHGGASHWVVMDAEKSIVYNSLADSRCVRLGEPDWSDVRAFYKGA